MTTTIESAATALLRAAFITAALDAGVPLRDVQIAARHADPRTTTRCRPSLQLCGFVVATSADEAWNRRCVRLPLVTELPGETTLLEAHSTCSPEGEDGEAERNCGRAKEDGPACPHHDVPEVEGLRECR
jgi:hypothetical protein